MDFKDVWKKEDFDQLPKLKFTELDSPREEESKQLPTIIEEQRPKPPQKVWHAPNGRANKDLAHII